MTIEELSQLSDEELRVKVAEKMGVQTIYFKAHYMGHGGPTYTVCCSREDAEGYPFNELGIEEFVDSSRIPPFSTSLDAIHEAEKTLTREQRRKWVSHLDVVHPESLLFSCYDEDELKNEAFLLIHATARQRAIAFLLV